MNDYINFGELIDGKERMAESELSVFIDNEIINENNNESIQNLYQIQGIKDTNRAVIRLVAYGDKRPQILLKEFMFKNYNCKIISYLLNTKDTNKSNNTNYKMISLIISIKNEPMYSISIEFNTLDKIDLTRNIELNGKFLVYLEKKDVNKNIILHEFDKYPGNNNMVEKLIKFLLHEELLFLY